MYTLKKKSWVIRQEAEEALILKWGKLLIGSNSHIFIRAAEDEGLFYHNFPNISETVLRALNLTGIVKDSQLRVRH